MWVPSSRTCTCMLLYVIALISVPWGCFFGLYFSPKPSSRMEEKSFPSISVITRTSRISKSMVLLEQRNSLNTLYSRDRQSCPTT